MGERGSARKKLGKGSLGGQSPLTKRRKVNVQTTAQPGAHPVGGGEREKACLQPQVRKLERVNQASTF